MRWTSFGWRFWLGGVLTLLLTALLGLALAGHARAAEDDGWRVGRIAATQGQVWLLDREDGAPADSRDDPDGGRWHDSRTAALTNWPLGRGDLLRTAPDGRATLQIDTLTLRLGADTELRIERLDAARVVLWLPQGDLALHVLAEPVGHAVELRTPEGRLWPLHLGHYRASRRHDSTQATAWAGEWRFEADDSALTVAEGRRADFWLQGRPPRTHYAWVGVDRDAFADWARREARADALPPAAQAPELAGLPGAGELQRWGDWRDDPEAGRIWLPRELPPGWAPYRDGRWAWVSPWGWTWIDAAPWGFAPFHYGQWLLISGRWAWAPGPRVAHRRYVPVLPGWGHEVPRQPLPPRAWPRQEHPRPEPPRGQPLRPEFPRIDPQRPVPPRTEPPRMEPPRMEPPRVPRVEPPRAEPPRVEPPRVEPTRPPVTAPATPPAPRVDPGPQTRPDARPEGRPEGRPDVRPDGRPSPGPEPQPQARPESRPGPRPAPAAREEREEREPRRREDRVQRAAP